MRRSEKEITDKQEIADILKKCDVCHLALFDQTYPYIIPLNFGFSFEDDHLELYFHGAKIGKKLSLIENNPNAAFELDCSLKVIADDIPCDYSMEYESVCGNGTIQMLEGEAKIQALTFIMKQYSKEEAFHFNENHLNATAAFKLSVHEITGKRDRH